VQLRTHVVFADASFGGSGISTSVSPTRDAKTRRGGARGRPDEDSVIRRPLHAWSAVAGSEAPGGWCADRLRYDRRVKLHT